MSVRSIVTYGLLGLIAFAPFPLASNRPWSWSILCLTVAILMGLWIVAEAFDRDGPPVSISLIATPATLFLLVCLFAMLQTLPGVPDALRSPYWSLIAAHGDGTPSTVSAAPHQTWTALMRLLAYGCVFWLALQTSRSGQQARRAVMVLAITTAIYSGYGLIVKFSGWETILWYEKWAYKGDLTSTFVNRNSYATFAGLGVLCGLAAFFSAVAAVAPSGDNRAKPFRNAITITSNLKLTGFLALACVLFNASAVFLTASRAGVGSTVLATLVLVYGAALRQRASRWRAFGLPALLLIAVVGLFQLSGERLEQRLDWFAASDGLADRERMVVYRETIRAVGDNTIFGTGYGTYTDVFKSYRNAEIGSFYDKAHNTYLELAFELGPVAAALLVLAVVVLIIRCLKGILRRSGQYIYAWLGFSASVLVGVHALVDFSLQIPAVAVLYAAILGIGCAQSWSSRFETRTPHLA